MATQCIQAARTYEEEEKRTQGEESEKAVEIPASARAPARVWKRMADDIALSPLDSWRPPKLLGRVAFPRYVMQLMGPYVTTALGAKPHFYAHLGEQRLVGHGLLDKNLVVRNAAQESRPLQRFSRDTGRPISYIMFAKPRPKKSILPPPTKKRKATPAVAEINFDFDARHEYLTGFHKRKQQRIKHAQEEAARKVRQERIETRKLVINSLLTTEATQLLTRVTRRARIANGKLKSMSRR